MSCRLLFYNLDVANNALPRVQRADRPRGGAACSRRLMVRTAAFQAANAGSIPAGNANESHLAVAQLASAPRRDEVAAGSNPAGETTIPL